MDRATAGEAKCTKHNPRPWENDFKKRTESVGLKIYPEKTKILSKLGSNRRKEVTIDNIKVEVLPVKERAKYLG